MTKSIKHRMTQIVTANNYLNLVHINHGRLRMLTDLCSGDVTEITLLTHTLLNRKFITALV